MSRYAEAPDGEGDGAIPQSGGVPLALYLHIPWCVRKCPYCDFNSHAVRGELPERAYVDALLADLERDLPLVWGRGLVSVFIGGGTPSLFSGEAIDRLLAGVRARLRLVPGTEVTLEANPGAVDAGRFADYRGAGVNRLSIGVQSLDDALLGRIGRIHCAREALDAVDAARQAGFENLNLDMMYGLPGQDPTGARRDLALALALEPEHLSHYQLTLEPNTPFHHDPPALPDDDALWEMQRACQDLLAEAGYRQYEVSAYARPGSRCRHNLNYWEFGDYLGIGAGAHGKITTLEPFTVRRLARERLPRTYLTATEPFSRRVLEPPDLVLEFMLNVLRLVEGVPLELFRQRTGLSPEVMAGPLREAGERGLLESSQARICPTPRGRRFLNDLQGLFLS